MEPRIGAPSDLATSGGSWIRSRAWSRSDARTTPATSPRSSPSARSSLCLGLTGEVGRCASSTTCPGSELRVRCEPCGIQGIALLRERLLLWRPRSGRRDLRVETRYLSVEVSDLRPDRVRIRLDRAECLIMLEGLVGLGEGLRARLCSLGGMG